MRLYDCINFQLSATQNMVSSYFKARLAPLDITPSQYSLLACLWDEDMQSPSQLSQKLNLDPSSMSGLVSRLEAKKLIERIYSKEDKRSVNIHITDAGLALKTEIMNIIDDANVVALEGMTDEEHQILVKCFALIQSNMQKLKGEN